MNVLKRVFGQFAAYAVISWISISSKDRQTPRSVRDLAFQKLKAAKSVAELEGTKLNSFGRALLWGGLHPIKFSALVVGACLLLSSAFLPAARPEWVWIYFPALRDDYSHASFFGTVWSVHATLVALVYPIVLTFVPILLQRRATAKYSLAVYMQDSGVVPAGTSSLLLLATMGVEYLASPYFPQRFFLFGAISNGLWFLANLALTGRFLIRTIKYVEGEFGEEAYRRLAAQYVLWRDLQVALGEYIFEKFAHKVDRHPSKLIRPVVSYVSLGLGQTVAARVFNSERVLSDINLLAVNWVVRRWLIRAIQSPNKMEKRLRSTLEILPNYGETYSGAVEIARVANGPALTWIEIFVLLSAFRFDAPKRQVLEGSTSELLDELAAEVQAQLESGNFSKAKVGLEKMRGLHTVFLVASGNVPDIVGLERLGQLRAPWAWSGRSITDSWLDSYRSILQVAASKVEQDQTIWPSLVYLPSNLIRLAKVQDPIVVLELLQLFTLLDHFLSSWWTREIHRSQAAISRDGAVLPQPARDDYQNAITSSVSALSNFRNQRKNASKSSDEEVWDDARRVTSIWLYQLNVCATLLHSAVARGDVLASRWYCDNITHWLSERAYEYGNLVEDFDVIDVDVLALDVLNLSWKDLSSQANEKANAVTTAQLQNGLLWQTLKRQWEAMRLLGAALILQAGEREGFEKLAGTIASRLLSANYFQRGLNGGQASFSTVDEILRRYIELCCIDLPTGNRAYGFAERARRHRDFRVLISGWTYGGESLASHPQSFVGEIAAMLLAVDNGDIEFHTTVERLRQVDSLDSLRQVGELLDALAGSLQTNSFKRTISLAASFRADDERAVRKSFRPFHLLGGVKNLRALVESRLAEKLSALMVSEEETRYFLKRLSSSVLKPTTKGRKPRLRISYKAKLNDYTKGFQLGQWLLKENLTFPPLQTISDRYVEQFAEDMVSQTIVLAFKELIEVKAISPIQYEDDGDAIKAVVLACDLMRETGIEPIIIAPLGSQGWIVTPYRWGWGAHPTLPDGITIAAMGGDGEMRETFAVNGYEAHQLQTPENAFYVVPREWFDALVFEAGESGLLFDFKLKVKEPKDVWLVLSWKAELSNEAEAGKVT